MISYYLLPCSLPSRRRCAPPQGDRMYLAIGCVCDNQVCVVIGWVGGSGGGGDRECGSRVCVGDRVCGRSAVGPVGCEGGIRLFF